MIDQLNKEIYLEFKEAGEMMTAYGYELGEKARLFMEVGKYVYATKEGASLGNLKEGDIEILANLCLPISDPDFKAMAFFQTPFLMKALKMGKGFGASLDDMAQIIGNTFAVTDIRSFTSVFESQDFINHTKKSSASSVITDYNEDTNELDGFYATIGRDLKEAVIGMEVLEKSAEVTFLGDKIGFTKMVNPLDAWLEHRVYQKKYSKNRLDSFEHQKLENVSDSEMQKRKDLVDYGLKLVSAGLVQGTWGNISIRLDDEFMLVTPSGLDYTELLPEDMVKVNIKTLDYEGLKPTSEKSLHAGIYKERKDVNAIVHTHSKYCSVFAACETNLPTKEEKDREKYGPGFKVAHYGLSGTKTLATNTAIALDKSLGALMAHHGMVAVGSSIDDAFNNAIFMENNAKALLDSIPLKDYSIVEETTTK